MNNDVVIINLDRPRQLKFGHTALKTLVSMTGKTIEELDTDLDVSNFDMLEQLVYCGLLKDAKEHNETLTVEKIPELLDEAPSFAHVLEKAVSAWRIAFGAQAQAPEGNQKAPEGNQQAPAEKMPAKGNRSTGTKASE